VKAELAKWMPTEDAARVSSQPGRKKKKAKKKVQ
jgi:hypothetical protein